MLKRKSISLLAFSMAILFLLLTANQASAETILYNFTGSYHGFGDVVGPYLLARQELSPKNQVYLLLDDRAEKIMRIFLERPHGELSDNQNFKFVREADLPSLPPIARVVESFVLAREAVGPIVDVKSLLSSPIGLTIITEDMHSPSANGVTFTNDLAIGLGEATSPNGHFFFSAAGASAGRIGILKDESVEALARMPEQTRRAQVASSFVVGSKIRAIIERSVFPEALLTLAYGIHNEVYDDGYWKPFPGQFRSYVNGLTKISQTKHQPVIVFTPNKFDLVKEAIGDQLLSLKKNQRIFLVQESDLDQLASLENDSVYVVVTNPLSNRQFTGVTSVSDLPYMIEGDSAVSAAIQLGKPFVMMKGPWGFWGIESLGTALKQTGAKWATKVYPVGLASAAPDFSHLSEIASDTDSFTRLKAQTKDWSQSLHYIARLAKDSSLAEKVFAKIGDPVLRYSWAKDQYSRGQMSEAQFKKQVASVPNTEALDSLISAKLNQIAPRMCKELFAN